MIGTLFLLYRMSFSLRGPIQFYHFIYHTMFNLQLEFGFVSIKVCCGFRKHWYIKGLYSQCGVKVASFKVNLRKRRR